MSDHDPIRLEGLDPGEGDPGYWVRFHREVMGRVEPELARRRRGSAPVSQVVRSWAGAVVPAALAAAAAALFRAPEPSTDPADGSRLADVEEVLVEEPGDGGFLAVLAADGAVVDAEPEGF